MMVPVHKYAILLLAAFAVSCATNQQPNAQLGPNEKPIPHQKMAKNEYTDRDIVTNALLDSKGNMWFTTTREGIFKYDGITFTNFTEKDGLSTNNIWSVLEDKDGIIWFGTFEGLCKFDGTTFTDIPLPNKSRTYPGDNPVNPITNTNCVMSLLQDKKDNIWMGTLGNGAYKYDGENFTHYLENEGRKQKDSLYFNVIQSMVEDNEGNIWLTSQTHGGINKFDGESFTNFTKKDGLPDDMIFSSFKANDGGLWFGTLDGGLISYKENTFRYLDESDGLCNNMVSCFYQDKTGKLWIGSFRGSSVCWYENGAFKSFPADTNNNLVELRFITEDKDGNIWFGGRYGVLWRYDGEVLEDFTQLKIVV